MYARPAPGFTLLEAGQHILSKDSSLFFLSKIKISITGHNDRRANPLKNNHYSSVLMSVL
jgi:hypothetical protein